MDKLNILILFIEGIVSFFSPCVLPILPIYLSMLSNSSLDNIKSGKILKSSMIKNTFSFVLGISTTFFILGSSIKILSSFFDSNKELVMTIGGIIIVFMGLFYIGIIKSSLLNREKRIHFKNRDMNPVTAFLLGFTFSFGWTPCIGPILTSVLVMASNTKNMLEANLLLLVYTLGFIVPFILFTLFYGKLSNTMKIVKRHIDTIKKLGGVILIISGIIMIINGYKGTIKHLNIENNNGTKNNIVQDQSIENNNENSNQKQSNKIKPIDFTLYDQYGKEHKLSDYKGKTVFLNYWATWCPPCKEEMPYINELYKEYGDNKGDVIILGVASPNVSREGNEQYIKNFLKKRDINFPVVFDDGGIQMLEYGMSAFPSTLIIDKEGYVVQYIPGAMNKETMKNLIDSVKQH